MDGWAHNGQQPHHQAPNGDEPSWLGTHAPTQPLPQMPMQPAAPQGYVIPGAPNGQAPLGFRGGLIGVAPEQQQTMPYPMQQQVQQQPLQATAPPLPQMQQLHMQPQMTAQGTWAYHTPQGMQLVQEGPAAFAPAYGQIPSQQFQQPQPAMQGAQGAASTGVYQRRRVRWETIVPVAAIICFVGAVAILVTDFDRITGRDSGAATAAPSQRRDVTPAATPGADETATAPDLETTLIDAQREHAAGRYTMATALLQPLLDAPEPDAAVTTLAAQIDAASAKNTKLLTKLGAQRQAKNWSGVVQTIAQIKALRPLSDDLVSIRTQAQRKLNAAKKTATAKRAAPSRSTARGGGAPAAGGRPAAVASVSKPPASAKPPSSPPKAPGVANTGGGGPAGGVSGGQPTVVPSTAAPAAADGHTHIH